MEKTASSNFLFIFLLSYIFMVDCSSGSFLFDVKDSMQKPPTRTSKHNREVDIHTTEDDFTNPPFTPYPTTPVTNPVTTPATGTTTPPMITVPSGNPVTTDPINPPFHGGGGQPTIPAGGGQVVAPPILGNAPAVPGQSWCVARGGLTETALQVALDYACGIGAADCSTIQQGASCYNPNTLQNHASYAFNSYYQKNPVQTGCDFGGAAMVTNVNPSSGSCVFPTWSSNSASPATVSPTTTDPMPTPTADSSYGAPPIGNTGTPPTVLGASNPATGGSIGGYGESPPTASISSASMATGSLNGFIFLTLPYITRIISHGI